MANLITVLCCIVALAAPVFGADAPQKHALLIAVAKYEHSEMNRPEPLKYSEEDAKAIGGFLKEGGYQVDLLLGKSATRDAIRQKLEDLRRQGNSDGVVVVGLFGHGVEIDALDDPKAEVREGCFCPFDTQVQFLKDAKGRDILDANRQPVLGPDPASLLKLSEIMKSLKLAKAGHRVVFADCCRTSPNQARGRSFGTGFRSQDLPENTSVLFGCSPNEKAFEHSDWGHGAFTKCLLDEMRAMSSRGDVETATLAGALKKKVPALVATISPRDTQTPKLFSTDSVDLLLNLPKQARSEPPQKSKSVPPTKVPNDKKTNKIDKKTKSNDFLDYADYGRGESLWWGLGQKVDEPRAADLLLNAASHDHPLAMGFAAIFYHLGEQVPKNAETAAKWSSKALPQLKVLASDGNTRANHIMGRFYELGIGVQKDSAKAVSGYRTAANQGFAPAQIALSDCYFEGRGVPKDVKEAVRLVRVAAEQNFPLSQHYLGWYYQTGTGVPKDEAEAVKWYRKAADLNLPRAQCNLGNCYDQGVGVDADSLEAIKWYQMAADQNCARAQHNLGVCFMEGRGVERNEAEAVKWYKMAADQDFADSQLQLGAAYYNGTLVGMDGPEGIRWIRKAIANPSLNQATKKEWEGILNSIGEGR